MRQLKLWCALRPQVKESRETEQAINENRNKYRTVAARGAMLFFLLNSLNKIHAFYQFSLNAFVSVFSRGLDLAPGGRKKKPLRKTPSLRDQVRRRGEISEHYGRTALFVVARPRM